MAQSPDVDHEVALDPLRALDEREEAFLRALARVLVVVPRAFEADLGHAAGVTFSEFHTLKQLDEARGAGLRMSELAARTALTLGAVTRVMKALEAKGLADRRRSAADGRGHEAHLTEAGRARLVQVAPIQAASARRLIFDRLDPAALDACADAFARIGTAGVAAKGGTVNGDR